MKAGGVLVTIVPQAEYPRPPSGILAARDTGNIRDGTGVCSAGQLLVTVTASRGVRRRVLGFTWGRRSFDTELTSARAAVAVVSGKRSSPQCTTPRFVKPRRCPHIKMLAKIEIIYFGPPTSVNMR